MRTPGSRSLQASCTLCPPEHVKNYKVIRREAEQGRGTQKNGGVIFIRWLRKHPSEQHAS